MRLPAFRRLDPSSNAYAPHSAIETLRHLPQQSPLRSLFPSLPSPFPPPHSHTRRVRTLAIAAAAAPSEPLLSPKRATPLPAAAAVVSGLRGVSGALGNSGVVGPGMARPHRAPQPHSRRSVPPPRTPPRNDTRDPPPPRTATLANGRRRPLTTPAAAGSTSRLLSRHTHRGFFTGPSLPRRELRPLGPHTLTPRSPRRRRAGPNGGRGRAGGRRRAREGGAGRGGPTPEGGRSGGAP